MSFFHTNLIAIARFYNVHVYCFHAVAFLDYLKYVRYMTVVNMIVGKKYFFIVI